MEKNSKAMAVAAMMAQLGAMSAGLPSIDPNKKILFKNYVPPKLTYVFSDEDKKLLSTLPAGRAKKALVKKLKSQVGPTYVPSESNSAPRGFDAIRSSKKAA